MNTETPFPKYHPKGEVLRKAAERYPDIDLEAIEIILSIKQIVSAEECVFQQKLEPYGLSEGRFYVLCHLFSEEILGHKDPSPSEIAERLGVTRATITGLLDGLERDGFLERHHDCQDRRALTIHMTSKGQSVLNRFVPEQCQQAKSKMSQLSLEEKRTLIRLLAKLQP
ncbi:MAG: MarR family winged helix-turn-helix transcriptional regulator [Janthinobacterium lividum]